MYLSYLIMMRKYWFKAIIPMLTMHNQTPIIKHKTLLVFKQYDVFFFTELWITTNLK